MASERARALRRNLTDAERFLWAKRRGRRFAEFKFRRQQPIGKYIVDFVCFERKLIVKLDGSQHVDQRDYDDARTAWLGTQGFRVLRFWNHEVLTEWNVIDEVIWAALQAG